MIVICSQCQTQFNVPPDAIAQGEGRMVRCSQCGHEWLQLPEKQVSTPQEKKLSALRMQSATTSSAQHPQPSDDTAHYVYKAVALVLLVVVLIVGYHERFVLRHIPSLGRAYAALQFQNTENVSLYDIEVTRTADSARRHDMVVKAVIKNESSGVRFIPNVRISLLNKRQEVLKVHEAAIKVEKLAAGEETTLRTALWDIPQSTALVVVDLGNAKELLVR